MNIHTRFRLDKVERSRGYYKEPGAEQETPVEAAYVHLNGVRGEPFGNATPSAHTEMLIVNPTAAKVFFAAPIGMEFDVYFSPITKEP